jgi:hypothetical protein
MFGAGVWPHLRRIPREPGYRHRRSYSGGLPCPSTCHAFVARTRLLCLVANRALVVREKHGIPGLIRGTPRIPALSFAGIRGVWVNFLANSDRGDSVESKTLTLCWDRSDLTRRWPSVPILQNEGAEPWSLMLEAGPRRRPCNRAPTRHSRAVARRGFPGPALSLRHRVTRCDRASSARRMTDRSSGSCPVRR